MNEPTHTAMTRRRWLAFLFPTPLLVLIPLLLPSKTYAQGVPDSGPVEPPPAATSP